MWLWAIFNGYHPDLSVFKRNQKMAIVHPRCTRILFKVWIYQTSAFGTDVREIGLTEYARQ